MDKFGVVLEDEDNNKTAADKGRCPKCGEAVDPTTPRYCNNCGTEPWEKRPPAQVQK
jgi:uncharacterized OB-fold protein